MNSKILCDTCQKEMSIAETWCDNESGLELCLADYESQIIAPLRLKEPELLNTIKLLQHQHFALQDRLHNFEAQKATQLNAITS